jgi:hypothetical protein
MNATSLPTGTVLVDRYPTPATSLSGSLAAS